MSDGRPGAGGGDEPVIRVLLADDQDLVRAGFRMILGTEEDLRVVGEAGDGLTAVRLTAELRPDVVLMDVQMPDMDGLRATREIVRCGTAQVIILTTFDRDDYLFDALRAGAAGFLLKNSSPEDLVDAVRVVARGEALLAPAVTRRVIASFASAAPGSVGSGSVGSGSVGSGSVAPGSASPGSAAPNAVPPGSAAPGSPAARLASLTERETDVLRRIARGESNAEIAVNLFLGEATVKTHVSRVLMKLGLRDRVQAAVFAYESGLVAPGG